MSSNPSAVRLIDRGWAAELEDGVTSDPTRLRIVCPFIKRRALDRLLAAATPDRLQVITRFNLADFGNGVSDTSALRRIIETGGRVRGVRGLHAKVFLFGDLRAAITSANMTLRGLGANHEFGCVSEEPAFVTSCADYFERLWSAAGTDLTAAELDTWDDQLERFLIRGGRPGQGAQLPDHGEVIADHEASVRSLIDPPVGWSAESGQAFVKFFGEGSNRVAWSHSVRGEVERSGCHWACTYPTTRRPRSVRDGDTLFVARLVRDPRDTIIFGRAIGRAHRPGLDEASASEIAQRPWKAHWGNYVRVHHSEFLAGTLENGITLSALIDALGSDAFATTQRNARAANGLNTNPRRAFMQQPAVLLSHDGAEWITARLEEAFLRHGRLPAAELDGLDWPSL